MNGSMPLRNILFYMAMLLMTLGPVIYTQNNMPFLAGFMIMALLVITTAVGFIRRYRSNAISIPDEIEFSDDLIPHLRATEKHPPSRNMAVFIFMAKKAWPYLIGFIAGWIIVVFNEIQWFYAAHKLATAYGQMITFNSFATLYYAHILIAGMLVFVNTVLITEKLHYFITSMILMAGLCITVAGLCYLNPAMNGNGKIIIAFLLFISYVCVLSILHITRLLSDFHHRQLNKVLFFPFILYITYFIIHSNFYLSALDRHFFAWLVIFGIFGARFAKGYVRRHHHNFLSLAGICICICSFMLVAVHGLSSEKTIPASLFILSMAALGLLWPHSWRYSKRRLMASH